METEMELRSIIVSVDVTTPDSAALRYAIDLAKTTSAELIGLAADQPDLTFAGMDGGVAVDLYAMEQTEVETQLKRAEEAFRKLVPASIKSQWLAYVTTPTAALIDAAATADLIVTASKTTTTFQEVQSTNLGELVVASGRPVIDVSHDATKARLDKVCIGWKDTREARHAVADALPLLKRAKEIRAVTIDEGDYAAEKDSLDALIAWLRKHDIAASCEVITNPEGFVDVLESTALSWNADLLVIGGYGHSRMREWLFGGMTRRILRNNSLNRFISN
jgi:nucleotide-binding universal stress UspA family protein